MKEKITYVPHEGVVVEDRNRNSFFFKLGSDILKNHFFSYTFEDEDPEDCSSPLYLFFNETFRIWTEKDKKTILGMACENSFILKGYELIGMDFKELLQLGILRFDYVEYDRYWLGSNINFRYYTVYYNLEYNFSIYVWRKKIRRILINSNFFTQKKYEDIEYLESLEIIKL